LTRIVIPNPVLSLVEGAVRNLKQIASPSLRSGLRLTRSRWQWKPCK